MRAKAFRGFLISYDVVQGLILLASLGFVLVSDNLGYNDVARLAILAIAVVHGALMVAVNIGTIRNDEWGPKLGIAHACLYMAVLMISQVSLEKKRPAAQRHSATTPFNFCPYLLQIALIFAAVKALRTQDTSQATTQFGPVQDALTVLALAAHADGMLTPEKRAMALQFSAQLTGQAVASFDMQQRITNMGKSPAPDQLLARSAANLSRAFTLEQKQWLVQAATSICGANGALDALAETFLSDLAQKLNALGHEPFGSAQN